MWFRKYVILLLIGTFCLNLFLTPKYSNLLILVKDNHLYSRVEESLSTSSDNTFVATTQSAMQWEKTYGGSEHDKAYSLIETADSGFVLAGYTNSYGAGNWDFWLVKTDAEGNMEWEQTYGGSKEDSARSIIQMADGGFAITGYTFSYGAGGSDAWLVKTDASGVPQWNQTYGGAAGDWALSIIETIDGGFALTGATTSSGAGEEDVWLVKTDASGSVEWTQTYGGSSDDEAYAVIETADGGFVLAGYTRSYGESDFFSDMWLVKTDTEGNMKWEQTYGGTEHDLAFSIIQTIDGGYALTGYTWSYGAGSADIWLVKTDFNGAAQWNKTYGGSDFEESYSIIQTSDGGFVIVGQTYSYGAGDADAWIVTVDSNGVGQWTQTYGGADGDITHMIVETADGGFAFAGLTYSYRIDDMDAWLVKIPPHQSNAPILSHIHVSSIMSNSAVIEWMTEVETNIDWVEYGITTYYDLTVNATHNTTHSATLTQLDPETSYHYRVCSRGVGGVSFSSDYTFKATNQGLMQWNQTYGGFMDDIPYSVIETSDGGFAIVGYTRSYGAGSYDAWLVKTDDRGVAQWNQTYGGSAYDFAYSVIETKDGGFALAGSTGSYGRGDVNFWLVKTDTNGMLQWNQTYGGPAEYRAYSVIQTSDGGFALVGSGGLFVKTDANGNEEWTQTYDGSFYSIIKTKGGGYVLAGSTKSSGAGDENFWLVKTDIEGNMEWEQTYGDTYREVAYAVIETTDGGFTLVGNTWKTRSYGKINSDIWLVITDANGMLQWTRTYGDHHDETAQSIIETADSEIVIAGYTESYGSGEFDVWLVKINVDGIPQWSRTYGGSRGDMGYAVIETVDGGFALAGTTASYGAGLGDFWLVKTLPSDITPPELSSPPDIVYEQGSTGHIISWVVGDRNPDTYTIYTNSVQVNSDFWTNGTIVWNVDGLVPGTYNITLVIRDTSHNSASDTVLVTITIRTSITSPATTTLSERSTSGLTVLLSLMVIVVLSMRRERR